MEMASRYTSETSAGRPVAFLPLIPTPTGRCAGEQADREPKRAVAAELVRPGFVRLTLPGAAEPDACKQEALS